MITPKDSVLRDVSEILLRFPTAINNIKKKISYIKRIIRAVSHPGQSLSNRWIRTRNEFVRITRSIELIDVVGRPVVSNETLRAIVSQNRAVLSQVDSWLDIDTWKNSRFGYGVPERILPTLDMAVGDELTYSDLLIYLMNKLSKPIRYLEIGVSVGKNFWQVVCSQETIKAFGLDWEECSPALQERMPSLGSSSPNDSSPKTALYKKDRKEITYVTGDEFDPKTWEILTLHNSEGFNVVFSDASHSEQAILTEYERLISNNLVKDKFILWYDDLNNHEMKAAFFRIANDMRSRFGLDFRENVKLFKIQGWVGIHAPYHLNGVITSLDLSDLNKALS